MQDYSLFAEREKSGWTNTSVVDAYVEKFGPITDEVGAVLVEKAGLKPGQAALDLCCGQGSLTAMLSASGAQVSGLDFSPEFLRLAAKAAPDALLFEGDAANLPFDDGSFDVVVCNFGMMHLPDRARALAQINRVLRPGGKFLMATWASPEASPAMSTMFDSIKTHADFSNATAQPDLFTFTHFDTAKQMMGEAGLALQNRETLTPAWQLAAPEELFDIMFQATVGVAMLLKSQEPQVIEAIRDQVTATVKERFANGAGFRVPVPVVVIAAKKL